MPSSAEPETPISGCSPSGSRSVEGLSHLKMPFWGEFSTINTFFFEPDEGLDLVPAWSDLGHHREFGHFRGMAVSSPQSWAGEQIAHPCGDPGKAAGSVLPFCCDSHGAELSSAPTLRSSL